MQERYIEVGYEDKIVFTPNKKTKGRSDIIATWRRSQGLWADHLVFRDMTVKEVIEWLRGKDCDVEVQSRFKHLHLKVLTP